MNAGLMLDAALMEKAKREGYKMRAYFPDTGEFRRELYPKHIAFMKAGAVHRERAFIAANRIGKSETAAFELACHLTGLYTPWWEGRRFNGPIAAWAAGNTTTTTRDIQQAKLLGGLGARGTGMIPAHTIIHVRQKSAAVAEAVEQVWVAHVSGGHSILQFRSYDQGRKAFEGTAQHVIWLDEECDESVYMECLTRTMTTDGLIMLTFTPLLGITPLVLSFLENKDLSEIRSVAA